MEFFLSRPVRFFTFDPTVFVLSEKSGSGTGRGSEDLGIRTETGMMFFHPYFRSSIFGRNFSEFVSNFYRILAKSVKHFSLSIS
jgi:hypothetical protein